MSMIQHEIEQLEALKAAMKLDVDMGRVKAKSSIDSRIKVIDGAIDTIRKLSAKVASESMERSNQYYNGGWIPTSERLPSEYGEYLVSTKPFGVCVKSFNPDGFFSRWHALSDSEVLAYMPLPQPYQEEQSDKTASD